MNVMDENGNTPISFIVDGYGTLNVGTARDLISDNSAMGDESDGDAFREYLISNEVVCEVPY